ncbi:MAG: hypothetical protein J6R73_05365, partial [Alistipes sp.]|nr:hypothetical protein [Alistipes sp.]
MKQFLEEVQQRALEERNTNLIKWGFVEIVECPKGEHDDFYLDRKLNRRVYYKRVAIDVSDEDYQAILAAKATQATTTEEVSEGITAEDVLSVVM